MNKILPFILTTVIGFAVGVYAGMWMKNTQPATPPPPAAVLDELKDAPLGSSNPAPAQTASPNADPRREEARRQFQAEMEAYRKKVDEIKNSLRSQMEPILTSEQRERMKRWRERPSPPSSASGATGQQRSRGPRNFWEGFDSAMTIVMVPFTLERFEDSLKLTPEQKEAVHKLLIERREKLLELVDKTPPPTFKLIRMIPPEAKAKASKK